MTFGAHIETTSVDTDNLLDLLKAGEGTRHGVDGAFGSDGTDLHHGAVSESFRLRIHLNGNSTLLSELWGVDESDGFRRGCCDANNRIQVVQTAELFRAKVIDVAPESVTLEATGTRDKLDALLRVLDAFGIREIVQSGTIAPETRCTAVSLTAEVRAL